MTNSRISLSDRTRSFSKDILLFCAGEKLTIINKSLIDQLIRSATSIGANYAEANNAASKADFRNKIFIAKKEAAETKYWLEVLRDITADKTTCEKLTQECHYILMTLQKIVNTLNGKQINDSAR